MCLENLYLMLILFISLSEIFYFLFHVITQMKLLAFFESNLLILI